MSIISSGGSLSNGTSDREILDHRGDGDHHASLHGSEMVNSLSSTTSLSNGSYTTQLPNQAAHSKKKRNPPGNPDPSAEVIALSPHALLAKNRFVCEICSKGFQRDQNLQLHRRGHNLPWKLRQRSTSEVAKKRVYICPEASCVHHSPARALGDLTGIKKHFSRKHGEKKWKCERCAKKYAVQSDWKAHSKTCGTREYKCECGTVFSRRDSFITHRAFCDAIAEENSKTTLLGPISPMKRHPNHDHNTPNITVAPTNDNINNGITNDNDNNTTSTTTTTTPINPSRPINTIKTQPTPDDHLYRHVAASHYMSATALLQKAAQMGPAVAGDASVMAPPSFHHHHDMYHDHSISSGDNNMGFFGGLLFGTHQNHAGSNVNKDVVLNGSSVRGNSGSATGGDVLTVDFLGVNGRSDHLNSNVISNNNNNIIKVLGDQDDHQVIRFNGGINNLQGLSHFEQHVWEV